jgi:hypothetical protein
VCPFSEVMRSFSTHTHRDRHKKIIAVFPFFCRSRKGFRKRRRKSLPFHTLKCVSFLFFLFIFILYIFFFCVVVVVVSRKIKKLKQIPRVHMSVPHQKNDKTKRNFSQSLRERKREKKKEK